MYIIISSSSSSIYLADPALGPWAVSGEDGQLD